MFHCRLRPTFFSLFERNVSAEFLDRAFWTVILLAAFKLFPRFCTLRAIACERKERNWERKRERVEMEEDYVYTIHPALWFIMATCFFLRVINPNFVINQRFEEPRGSARVDIAIVQKLIFRQELKWAASRLTSYIRHVAEFSLSLLYSPRYFISLLRIRTGLPVKLDEWEVTLSCQNSQKLSVRLSRIRPFFASNNDSLNCNI